MKVQKSKKRWWPKNGERFYMISEEGEIYYDVWLTFIRSVYEWSGVYKTRREAVTMRNAIQNFVAKKIGET